MIDSVAAREAEWGRRRTIAKRWGGGSAALAFLCVLAYWAEMSRLPAAADISRGLVFKILNIEGGRHSHAPLFRYGNHIDLIVVLALVAVMLISVVASLVIFYEFDPGALYRGSQGRVE